MAKDRKILVHIRREITSAVASTWETVEITGIPSKGIIRRIRWDAVSGASPRVAYLLSEAPFTTPLGAPPVVRPVNRLLTSFPLQVPGPLDHVPGYTMYLPLTEAPPEVAAVPAPGQPGQGPAGQFLDFYETDTLHLAWQTNNITTVMEIQIDIEVLGV